MSNEELVAVIQAGATEHMGELWEQVAGLVKWKANHIMTALDLCGSPCGVGFEDLYQSGYLALVEAVETYNPTAGAFSTWLMYYLRKAFAETAGYRTQKGRQEPLNNYLSLDTPLTDDADSDDLMDVVADPAGLQWRESLENIVWREQLHEALEVALATIPEKYADVMRLRHYQDLSLAEVGKIRGISRERIRQMENKAIRQLRKPSVACHLQPFIDFDFYCGTGLRAFQHAGMSIQERYLVLEEDRKERAEQRRRQEQERKNRLQEKKIREGCQDISAQCAARAADRVAKMTPEEKLALLEKYGYT